MFDPINAYILRAGAWLVMVLCLVTMAVVLDIWNCSRARHPSAATGMILFVLASTLLYAGGIFARCAWTGAFPK